MKKFLSVLLALCLTAFTLVPAFAAEEADAVIDGTWKILVAADDTAQANYAAKKIQSVLAEALGTPLPIAASAEDKYIAVGVRLNAASVTRLTIPPAKETPSL